MSTNNGQPRHDITHNGYAPDAPRPASPHPEHPSAHAEPGSASDRGGDTLASDTAPAYEPRGAREHAAQPPFVGSANAEPPSASEFETRNDSEREHSIDSEREPAITNKREPSSASEQEPASDRSTIDAYNPEALLHALAVLDFSPAALADQLNISPFALLDWLESEDTQGQLTRYQSLERQMLDLRSFKSRRLSIENLEQVLQTTQDLVEKRRTATTLLRLLDRHLTDQRAPSEPKPRSASDRPRSEARPGPLAEPGSASDHGDDTQTVPCTPSADPAARLDPLAEPPSQGDHEASSACDESDPRSGSDHGDAPNAIDSHSASGAQSLDQPAAQPPFVGSAHAGPPSKRELKIQSERELKIQPESEPKNPDANDGPNWDAFFPEAFTGRNGPSAPKPHQRE